MRFGQDHTGGFKEALDGVATPESQVAANDYAIGLLVEAVAKSRYAADTLILTVEDDSQDGPDHVDAHRSLAFVAGPYVKQGAVVSTRYSTVNVLRTIEDLLGLDHVSLYTATQSAMTEVFDVASPHWTFSAVVPEILRGTRLPLPPATAVAAPRARPTHEPAYWIAATEGMDFSTEDSVDAEAYNRILWKGLMPNRPYPQTRSGDDLSIKR
ncbi:MAG TPA: hypothetical protein VN878_01085 [Usitatibacter sp.]|nr:hypothetical protein [Usitatibacter sp.]